MSEFITDPMLGCLVASREAGAIRCSAKEWGFFLPDKFLEFFRWIDSVEIRAQFIPISQATLKNSHHTMAMGF